jgi:thiol:disulfide interchange protein DsbC
MLLNLMEISMKGFMFIVLTVLAFSVNNVYASADHSSKKAVSKSAEKSGQGANEADLLKRIKKEYPNLNAEKVSFIKSVNLYEVRFKDTNNLSYTNNNMDFFIINGQIINPKTKQNITTERDLAFVREFVNNLPYDKSIMVKYGTGERKIVIFTDPDCPFCKDTDKMIHSKMKNDNITINYFMNPLRIPGHEDAPLKARKIWCSQDRSTAWVNWMVNGMLPNNDGSCKNPVDETKKIGTDSGFNSTPTIIFDNGYIWKGSITPEQIRDILNK